MRIIKDSEKQINLHPFVVYFVLSPKLKNEYGDALKRLNRCEGFTRGIFKFNVVSHLGESGAKALSPDLQNSMKRYNMMVRLVDDPDGNFYYALHQVNFNKAANLVEASLQRFVIDVCKQNLIHLDELQAASLNSSANFTDRLIVLEKMRLAFKGAISFNGYSQGVWAKLTTPAQLFRDSRRQRGPIVPRAAIIERLTKQGFTVEDAKRATQIFWEMVGVEFNLPSEETSDNIAAGIASHHYSSHIERDHKRRLKPLAEPDVHAEIKKVVSRRLKHGREKREWGVELKVNGDIFPIYFGSKDCTMIYICTLLRKKVGENMYLHEFFNNSKGTKSMFKRSKSHKWLEAVYNKIFPSTDKGFDNWIANVEEKSGRPINQGKTQASNAIERTLESRQPDGIYYCIMSTKKDRLGDSFYDIQIKSENIIVPEEMWALVDGFYDIMGMEHHGACREPITE